MMAKIFSVNDDVEKILKYVVMQNHVEKSQVLKSYGITNNIKRMYAISKRLEI